MSTNWKKQAVKKKMAAITQKWKLEFHYICYGVYLGREEKQILGPSDWGELQADYREIDKMHWENDREYLKRYQAEAYYQQGAIDAEKGNYDQACAFLMQAKAIMEELALQYIIPQCYCRTYLYLIKSYIEKRHNEAEIALYFKKAGAILRDIEETNTATMKKANIPEFAEKLQTAELKKTQAELALLWIIQQNNLAGADQDSVADTPDEKKIMECLDFIQSTLTKLEGDCGKSCAPGEEDFWTRLWIRRLKDGSQTTKGVYYKWKYFNYFKKNASPDVSSAKQYFKDAATIFTMVLAADPQNTICMGNLAALFYDYKTKYRDPENLRFLQRLTKQTREIIQAPEDCATVDDLINALLNHALRVDPNGMFVLNLKTMLRKEKSEETDSYPYIALRQSALRKCFQRLDNTLREQDEAGLFPEEDPLRDIKLDIIDLHTIVAKYMNAAVYPRDRFKNLVVGHYTRLSVLSKLINETDSSRLRIQNVKHLNDPSEGSLFMGYVQQEMRARSRQQDESLIENLLRGYDYKNQEEWNQRSSVYMGCFTSRVDQLNMWSRYGEQGKGCCLVINAGSSFDKSASVSLTELSLEEEAYQFKLEDGRYPLYMVLYLPRNTRMDLQVARTYARGRQMAEREKRNAIQRHNPSPEKAFLEAERCAEEEKWWQTQAELIDQYILLMDELSNILMRLQWDFNQFSHKHGDSSGRIQQELINTVMIILDLVRFLVKDDAYRDEREYRVIQYSHMPKYAEDIRGIPKLYVDIERELQYREVCFGPLTQNYASDSAYVLNLRKKKQQKQGSIHVRKSEIPYCC